MKQKFVCHWEHAKYFPIITLKNMKTLFRNLGIEIVEIKEETIKRRVSVTFILMGTEDEQRRLERYMEQINTIS